MLKDFLAVCCGCCCCCWQCNSPFVKQHSWQHVHSWQGSRHRSAARRPQVASLKRNSHWAKCGSWQLFLRCRCQLGATQWQRDPPHDTGITVSPFSSSCHRWRLFLGGESDTNSSPPTSHQRAQHDCQASLHPPPLSSHLTYSVISAQMQWKVSYLGHILTSNPRSHDQ